MDSGDLDVKSGWFAFGKHKNWSYSLLVGIGYNVCFSAIIQIFS